MFLLRINRIYHADLTLNSLESAYFDDIANAHCTVVNVVDAILKRREERNSCIACRFKEILDYLLHDTESGAEMK